MLALAADENFNNDIVRGLLRRKPDLNIVRLPPPPLLIMLMNVLVPVNPCRASLKSVGVFQ